MAYVPGETSMKKSSSAADAQSCEEREVNLERFNLYFLLQHSWAVGKWVKEEDFTDKTSKKSAVS